MKLTFPLDQITENGGPEVAAYVATCSCSAGSDVFTVFQVVGSNHFHIECAQCENTHCPFGACDLQPTSKEDSNHDHNTPPYQDVR